MPKINRFRIVHLTYPSNHIITDETFDFDQRSTLIILANGGGKSVMTQMLIAPFMSQLKLMNFKERRMSNYFTTPRPTFLVQEWEKDNQAGRFVVGLMARRGGNHLESSDEEIGKVDFLAFVGEYRHPVPWDLDHLKLIDERPGGRQTYINWQTAKTYLTRVAEESQGAFRLYNLNNTDQRRRYLRHLQTLGIQTSEWEQLRSFNLAESGLSEMSKMYKTESKLIGQLFLPAVERKLDALANASGTDAASHLKSFQTNAANYVRLHLENKEKILQRGSYVQFVEGLDELSRKAQILKDHAEERRELLLVMKAEQESLQQVRQEEEIDLASLKETVAYEKKQIKMLQVEELSQQYYQQEDRQQKLEASHKAQKEKLAACQKELDKANLEVHQMEGAKIYGERQEAWQKEQEWNEKFKSASKSDEQIIKSQAQYGAALYKLSEQELAAQEAARKEGKEQQKEAESALELAKTEEAAAQKEKNQLVREHALLEAQMDAYQSAEQTFANGWELTIDHSLEPYADHEILAGLVETCQEQQRQKQDERDAIEKAIAALDAAEKEAQNTLTEKKVREPSLEGEIARCKEQLDALEQVLAEREKLLALLDMNPQNLYDSELITKKIDVKTLYLEEKLRACTMRQLEIEQYMEKLRAGVSLELPREMEAIMDKLQLPIVRGTQWLKENIKDGRKLNACIRHNPFLPYSLVLTATQIQQLRAKLAEQKVSTFAPVPLIDRDAIDPKGDMDFSQGGLSFYVHFDTRLLNPGDLQEMLGKEERLLSQEKEYEAQLHKDQEYLSSLARTFQTHPLFVNTVPHARTNLHNLQEDLKTLQLEISRLSLEQKEREQQKKEQKKKLSEAEDTLRNAQKQCSEAQALQRQFEQASAAWIQARQIEEKLAGIETKLDQLVSRQEFFRGQIDACKTEQITLDHLITQLKEQISGYEGFKDQPAAQGSRQELEARFKALSEKLSASSASLYRDNRDAQRKVKEKRDRELEKQLNKYHLLREDIEALPYLEERQDKLEQQANDLKERESALTAEIGQKEKELIRISTRMESLLDRIEERIEVREPLERRNTRTISLKPLQKAQEEKVKTLEARQQAKIKRQSDLETIANQLLQTLRRNDAMDLETEAADPDFARQDVKTIQDQLDNQQARLDNNVSHFSKAQNTLRTSLNHLRQDLENGPDAILDALRGLENELAEPDTLVEAVKNKRTLAQDQIDALDSNMATMQKQRDNLAGMLFDYTERMHKALKKIDSTTTIEINGTSRKMLTIVQPNWEDKKDIYRAQCTAFLEELVSKVEKDPANLSKIVESEVQCQTIYDRVVGISNLHVKTYKIEQHQQTSMSWEQIQKSSGAEGFLCSFVVLAALMAFQRSSEESQLSNRKVGSVMVMDNPFATTQSKHILDALMQMCVSTNTQLIALSAVENPAVVNSFDNIYSVRKMLQVSSNQARMRARHTKVPPETDQQVEIEPVQMELFVEEPDESIAWDDEEQ